MTPGDHAGEDDEAIAHRLPGYSARHATQRARRMHRLTVAAIVIVVVSAVGAVLAIAHASQNKHSAASSATTTSSTPNHATTVTATAASEPWMLAAALAGEVLLPGSTGQLVIMGGATSGDLLADGIFGLNTTNGSLTQLGDLTSDLDDAAGAVVDGKPTAFGGATPGVVDTIQTYAPSTTSAAKLSPATVTGALPEPRSAAGVAVVGNTVYLVGGFDGTSADPSVIESSNGQSFTTVATLPIAVRSAAVAVVGTKLFVFGGVALSGPDAGKPIATIQVVNLTKGKASVAGRLPAPVAGAAAGMIGDVVVIAGGDNQAAVTTKTTTTTTTAGNSGNTGNTGNTGTGATIATHNGTTGSSTTIWSFTAKDAKVAVAGQLPVAVSYSGVTVVGTTMWLVGGDTDGTPVSTVQSVTVPASS